MSAKKPDILQIRKYLNGELDAHAMHQLEREAQDDPFVMDALDGYEAATGLQQRPLDELDKRLQQRIDQSKVRRIIPWKYYAAAASVLIVFTLGYLLWPAGQPPIAKNKVAVTVPPPDHTITTDTIIKTPPKESMLAAVTSPPAARSMVSRAQIKRAAPVKSNAITATAINQPTGNAKAAAAAVPAPAFTGKINIRGGGNKAVVNEGYVRTKNDSVSYLAASDLEKKGRDSINTNRALREITIKSYGAQKNTQLTDNVAGVNTQVLQGKVEGVQVTTPDMISGIVMNQMGVPLPGAHIGVEGSEKGTSTDANGRFAIAATHKENLKVDYIGFQSRQVNAGPSDSVKIALEPANSALSEVAVVGYGAAKKPVKEAHPRMGWGQYNKYLKAKAITTDGKTGTVRLSFTVGEKGQLTNFHIDKGLNDAANQQAISLVKNGPVWAPDVNHQPQTIKLKIKFGKE